MNDNEISKELASLIQLDIDAIHAYDAAINNVDVMFIKQELTAFKADHERHVRELSETIRRLGNTPPAYTPDFKGFLIQGFTSIRSATGTEGALKAMKTNEELTNRSYGKAVAMDLPADIKAIVQKNLGDEQRHLRTIEQWINSRAWEQAGATV